METSSIRHFMSRHRSSLKDLALIVLIMLVSTFYAWQVDIFANEGDAPAKQQTIEVDELLLLGGVLMLARPAKARRSCALWSGSERALA
jgi:hypothetical protein